MACGSCKYQSKGFDLDPSLLRESGGLELLAKDAPISQSYMPAQYVSGMDTGVSADLYPRSPKDIY
jgi:hypothetical protein